MSVLDDAIERANDIVIGASLGVMDTRASEAEQKQGRYFMELFSGVRDVLRDGGTSSSIAALAEAVMSDGERR